MIVSIDDDVCTFEDGTQQTCTEFGRRLLGMAEARDIPSTNEIGSFFHCKRCMAELPPGMSPREWGALEVGFTKLGVQVWCKRHELNVVHIDFEGIKHPGNLGTQRKDK